MSEKSKKIVDVIEDTSKVSITVYEDILHPAAQETGSVLALIPQTIKAALAPLRQWIAQKEYNLSKTEKLLAQKLQNIKLDTRKRVS